MKQPKLTLLYDGNCPICVWEQRNLARRDRRGRLGFINIQSPEFKPEVFGVTHESLMGRLHAIREDGHMLVGVETLLASYRAVGWWVYLPLRLVPRRMLEFAYSWFADHRHQISRRIGHWFGPVCEQDVCGKR